MQTPMMKNLIIATVLQAMGMFLSGTTINGIAYGGGRSAGLAGISVALSDFWSLHNNQAGLAGYNAFAGGITYENKFMLNETGKSSIGVVFPVQKSTFGLSLQHFGYTAFREVKTGLAYARPIGDKLSVGIQLDYLFTTIAENYGSSGGLTFEVGVQMMLSDHLILAAHTFNPLAIQIHQNTGEKANSVYTLGILYHLTDQLLVSMETEKDLKFKPAIRAGVEYEISGAAITRIGYATLPAPTSSTRFSMTSEYSFGFGLNLNEFQLDIAAIIHTTLGWSPVVSLIYKFSRFE